MSSLRNWPWPFASPPAQPLNAIMASAAIPGAFPIGSIRRYGDNITPWRGGEQHTYPRRSQIGRHSHYCPSSRFYLRNPRASERRDRAGVACDHPADRQSNGPRARGGGRCFPRPLPNRVRSISRPAPCADELIERAADNTRRWIKRGRPYALAIFPMHCYRTRTDLSWNGPKRPHQVAGRQP